MESGLHEKLADVVARMRDLDCECRAKYAQMLKDGYEFRMVTLEVANNKLQDFMSIKYMEVAGNLKRDVRIFSGVNASVFLILVLISLFKSRAVAHLYLPGLLLFASTAICSFFYIFEQNWLFTLIYNDFMGFSYLGYVDLVFFFLCDIAFNHARITSEIVNAILDAIGSSLSTLSPC